MIDYRLTFLFCIFISFLNPLFTIEQKKFPLFDIEDQSISTNLQKHLDSTEHKNILQIGILNEIACVRLKNLDPSIHYTFIDNPSELRLIKEVLENAGIKDVQYFDFDQLSQMDLSQFDLVFSEEFFLRLEYPKNDILIQKIVKSIPYGYLVLKEENLLPLQKLGYIDKLVDTLLTKGRQGQIIPVEPLHDHDMVLKWKPHLEDLTDESSLSLSSSSLQNNAITFVLSGGRLGDNLLSYIHAKWLSYIYDLPLLFQPFLNCEFFCLFEQENYHSSDFQFSQNVHINRNNLNSIAPGDGSICYNLPYFPETAVESAIPWLYHMQLPVFSINWEDRTFKLMIKKLLAPRVDIQPIALQEDRINIAVHYRSEFGDNNTLQNLQRNHAIKFPSITYHIEQLQRLIKLFSEHKIFVYLFSDDSNPENLIRIFQEAIPNQEIQWATKKRTSSSPSILEDLNDFYSIGQFDCLVRSASNFSSIAAKLGNYIIEIAPSHYHFEGDVLVIDHVELYFNPSHKLRLKEKSID